MMMSSNPPDVLLSNDPGDETQRRYRYQAAYAAFLSVTLLGEASEFEEVFCEQHEDVLVKRRDGQFIGVQVKTRAVGLDLFKAGDDEVLKSLVRFAQHESNFVGRFARYSIVTNCGFWHAQKNGSNLPYLLELAQGVTSATATLPAALSKLLSKLTKTSKLKADIVMTMLKKTTEQVAPGFTEIHGRVVKALVEDAKLGEHTFDRLAVVARSLIDEAYGAASLAHDGCITSYLGLLANPTAANAAMVIEGKRLHRDRVHQTVQTCLSSLPTLRQWSPKSVRELPRSMQTLDIKMTAGGVSASNIALAKDWKYSAEYLLERWRHLHGEDGAEIRYQHIETLVATEAQEAYDSVRTGDQTFGPQMLQSLRHRLRERYGQEASALWGAKYEHLLGIAGVLSEDCRLWWSEQFDLRPTEPPPQPSPESSNELEPDVPETV